MAAPEYDAFVAEAEAAIRRQLAANERQQEQAARLLAGEEVDVTYVPPSD
jgi:hypothetical protein